MKTLKGFLLDFLNSQECIYNIKQLQRKDNLIRTFELRKLRSGIRDQEFENILYSREVLREDGKLKFWIPSYLENQDTYIRDWMRETKI